MGAVEHAVSLQVAGAAEANATHAGRPSIAGAACATTATASSCTGVSKSGAAGAVVGADAAQTGG